MIFQIVTLIRYPNTSRKVLIQVCFWGRIIPSPGVEISKRHHRSSGVGVPCRTVMVHSGMVSEQLPKEGEKHENMKLLKQSRSQHVHETLKILLLLPETLWSIGVLCFFLPAIIGTSESNDILGADSPRVPLPKKKRPKMATGPSLSAYRRGSNASREPPTFHLNKGMMPCWDQWINGCHGCQKKQPLHKVNVYIGKYYQSHGSYGYSGMSCWHYRI